MEAFHQDLREFHGEYHLGFHRWNAGFQLPCLFHVPVCLPPGNSYLGHQAFGCFHRRKSSAQPPKGEVEPLGMFGSGSARHMSQEYYRI